jgi:flagellar hook-length control protein FliK
MLGQLVATGVEAPAMSAAMIVAPEQMDAEGDDAEVESASADAFGLLPLPVPLPTTPAPAPETAKAESVDMFAELQLSRQKPAQFVIPMLSQDAEAAGDSTTPQGVERSDAPTPFDTALALHAEKALHATRSATVEASRAVHTPVGSAAWADDIGSRVTMMAKQGEQTASLRLSPEHLGPLEIRVAIRDDQASVWFGAAHADTRAAIENALPRLRELFEAQGMSLTDAGVYRDSPREQAAQGSSNARASDEAPLDAQPTETRTILGLVDAYA